MRWGTQRLLGPRAIVIEASTALAAIGAYRAVVIT